MTSRTLSNIDSPISIIHRYGAVRSSVLACFSVLLIPFAYAGGMALVITAVAWALFAAVIVRRVLFGGPPERDRYIV